MHTLIQLDADDLAALAQYEEEAATLEASLDAPTHELRTASVADLCSFLKDKVVPVLKTVKKIVCLIPWGAFKKACKLLDKAIDIIEGLCPA